MNLYKKPNHYSENIGDSGLFACYYSLLNIYIYINSKPTFMESNPLFKIIVLNK